MMGRKGVVVLTLFLAVILVALYLHWANLEDRAYSDKLEDYEKGESVYANVARKSGGDQLFLEPDTDLTAFLEGTRLPCTIWKQIGVLDGGGEISISVDTSVTTLGLALLGSSGREDGAFGLSAMDPEGSSIEAGVEGIKATVTKNGAIYTISSPAAGEWNMRISGSGSYQFSAKAETGTSCPTVGFIETGGGPGHERSRPVSGRLQAGKQHSFELRIEGPLSDELVISLVDEFGDVLEKGAIASEEQSAKGVEVVGRVAVPRRPFRFLLRAGSFQRVVDEIFDLETSLRTYSWTYRSSTPESDCRTVEFLLFTSPGSGETNQVIWTCAQNRTAAAATTTAEAILMIGAGELPEATESLGFVALGQLGDSPRELSAEQCERYAAVFRRLSPDSDAIPPAPTMRPRCASSGSIVRLHLDMTTLPQRRVPRR